MKTILIMVIRVIPLDQVLDSCGMGDVGAESA